jgi:hypothetical protein
MNKNTILALLENEREGFGLEISSKSGKTILRTTPSDSKASKIIQFIEANLLDDSTTIGNMEEWISDALFWVGALADQDVPDV